MDFFRFIPYILCYTCIYIYSHLYAFSVDEIKSRYLYYRHAFDMPEIRLPLVLSSQRCSNEKIRK